MMRALLLCVLLMLPQAAPAQCADYAKVAKNLKQKFGETMIFRGFSNSRIIETWANGGKGSWTIVQHALITMPGSDGYTMIACAKIVASGKGWSGQASAFFGLPDRI